MCSESSTFFGLPNLVPLARDAARLSAVRSLPDGPPLGPCPFRWAWACRLDGKTPDSRPLHIPAPDPGPWQTRQCPVEDLRLRAESSLAAVGWGVRRDRKSRTDLDVVDVRQLPVPPLLAAHVGGELGGHRRLGSG